jgi:hypothetical protein
MRFADNVIAKFGTGGDLQIKHNATASSIENYVGDLTILNTSKDSDILFKGDDGQANTAVTTYFYLDGSSAAHDGSATTALYTNWPDNSYISLGTGHDLQLVHTGVNSVIQSLVGKFEIMSLSDDLEFKQFGNDKDINFSSDDGSGGIATYFRLDGGEGHMIAYKELNFADGIPATFGNSAGGDLEIKEQSGSSYIMNHTGNLQIQNHQDDGDIVFSCDDGSGGVETYFYLDGSSLTTKFEKDLRIVDSVALTLGNVNDFILRHNGSNSEIINNTGNLEIRNQQDDGDIIFKSDDGSGGTTAYLTLDGGVNQIHIAKETIFADAILASFGADRDLRIQHSGSNSFIDNYTGTLNFRQRVDDGDIVFSCDDGSGGDTAYLTLDGSAGYTIASKTLNWLDGVYGSWGTSGDLLIYHDGSNSYINNATGNLQIKNSTDDGDIEFVCDDGSGGNATYMVIDGSIERVNFHKHTIHNDNIEASWGSNVDLRIKHDGTDSSISNYEGDLIFQQNADDKDIIFQSDDGSGGTTPYLTLDGGDVSTIVNTIKVLMPNLPTSDPGTTGQLWNDNGTLKISAGG